MPNDSGVNPEDFGLGAELDEALAEATGEVMSGDAESSRPTGFRPPTISEDSGRISRTDFSKLKMILDVPLKVSVELGRTKMLVNDLLQLGQGSVIELDKIAGEAMEILINDKLVAMGEVVVVNEKFGVRVN
jgi:flagellar motor switch protein FliN